MGVMPLEKWRAGGVNSKSFWSLEMKSLSFRSYRQMTVIKVTQLGSINKNWTRKSSEGCHW